MRSRRFRRELLFAILSGLLLFAGSYLVYRGASLYLAGAQVPVWAESVEWDVAGVNPGMCPGPRLVIRTAYTDGTDGGIIYSDDGGDFLWLFFKGKKEPKWAIVQVKGKLSRYTFKELESRFPSPCDVPRPGLKPDAPAPGTLGNI